MLIDTLLKDKNLIDTKTLINHTWFVAKPVSYGGFFEIKKRIKNAFYVLIYGAEIYQYAEDYFKIKGEVNA
jgi:hypothetical protein